MEVGSLIPRTGFELTRCAAIAFVACALCAPEPAFAAPALRCPPGTAYAESFLGFERATWCARKDTSREGPWVVWYDAKRMKEEGSFARDARTGRWRTWWPNGRPRSEGVYASGRRTGPWKTWFESGNLEQVATYDNDVLDGAWATWYRNGRKREEGRMASGFPVGDWTYWYENGKKMREGSYRPYAATKGAPIESSAQDSRWTFYWENGRKRAEGMYRFGMRDGVWKEWTEAGRERTVRYVGGIVVD